VNISIGNEIASKTVPAIDIKRFDWIAPMSDAAESTKPKVDVTVAAAAPENKPISHRFFERIDVSSSREALTLMFTVSNAPAFMMFWADRLCPHFTNYRSGHKSRIKSA